MINELRIRNFKVFGPMQRIKLAPITLIFGPNSGGKSTIIQSLLLLKQSIEESQGGAQRFLAPNGRWIDLGQSKSMHHLHKLEEGIELGISYTSGNLVSPFLKPSDIYSLGATFRDARSTTHSRALPQLVETSMSIDTRDGLGFKTTMERAFHTEASFPRDEVEDRQYRENRFRFRSLEDAIALIKFAANRSPLISDRSRILDTLTKRDFDSIRIAFRSPLSVGAGTFLPSYIRSPQDNKSIPPNTGPFSDVSRLLMSFARTYERAFSRISYLGPLRSRPKRIYEFSRQYTDTVGASGEFTIDALAQRNQPEDADGSIVEKLNAWFEAFEIPYTIELSGVGDEVLGDIAKLTLVDKRTGVRVAATDVGFGIGQVLPIVLEGILASGAQGRPRTRKTICVEQPELHLHPRLQANISDFLIETHKSGGCQWIVETHSESLMLRIQKRIREGKLSKDNVSVLYVDPIGSMGSDVKQLRLNDGGNFIDEWPGGFFEESFREMFF